MCRRVSFWLALVALALVLIGCAPKTPSVTITWSTGSELEIAGFVVERSDRSGGPFERVSTFIPASDDPFVGHDYQFADATADAGRTYWYRLFSISNQNRRIELGTIEAMSH
jgi:hypothetical protein